MIAIPMMKNPVSVWVFQQSFIGIIPLYFPIASLLKAFPAFPPACSSRGNYRLKAVRENVSDFSF